MTSLKRRRYYGRADNVQKNVYFEQYMKSVSSGPATFWNQVFIIIFGVFLDKTKIRTFCPEGYISRTNIEEGYNFSELVGFLALKLWNFEFFTCHRTLISLLWWTVQLYVLWEDRSGCSFLNWLLGYFILKMNLKFSNFQFVEIFTVSGRTGCQKIGYLSS